MVTCAGDTNGQASSPNAKPNPNFPTVERFFIMSGLIEATVVNDVPSVKREPTTRWFG